MATPIIPRIIRGRLYYQIADVFLPTFAQAAAAQSAAESHRLDIADELSTLIVRRAVALTEMRGADSDHLRFSAAARREAYSAARMRQLRAEVSRA